MKDFVNLPRAEKSDLIQLPYLALFGSSEMALSFNGYGPQGLNGFLVLGFIGGQICTQY